MMVYRAPRAKLTKKYRVDPDDIRLFSQDGTIWTQPMWTSDRQRADYWLVFDEETRKSEHALDSRVAREVIHRMLQQRETTDSDA
ncbi:hypothetical protein ACWDRB_47375 [Nonomuraea sp. NPDC003707]